MIETLLDLQREIASLQGQLYFFKAKSVVDILENINSLFSIGALGCNVDYSP